jgi:hypothetical protein
MTRVMVSGASRVWTVDMTEVARLGARIAVSIGLDVAHLADEE